MRIFGFGWLFLILEILSIVMMTSAIGGFNTILWMLCTFIIGVMMLRHFGRINMAMMNAGLRTGAPGSFMAAIWPIRFALAAILLLSPGIFSDLLAVIIMLPIWHIGGRFTAQTPNQQAPRGAYYRGERDDADADIIEGEYHEVNPREPRRGDQRILHKDD